MAPQKLRTSQQEKMQMLVRDAVLPELEPTPTPKNMEGIDPGFRRPSFRRWAKRSYTAAACEDSDFFDFIWYTQHECSQTARIADEYATKH